MPSIQGNSDRQPRRTPYQPNPRDSAQYPYRAPNQLPNYPSRGSYQNPNQQPNYPNRNQNPYQQSNLDHNRGYNHDRNPTTTHQNSGTHQYPTRAQARPESHLKPPQLTYSTVDLSAITKDASKLIEDGEKDIVFGPPDKGIFVMGSSKSGKTTLMKFLTDDHDQLVGKESSGRFTIETPNEPPKSAAYSIFPVLKRDTATKEVFYDCQEFNEDRPSDVDIATNYFLHKVVRFVGQLKVVLVANYESLNDSVNNENGSFARLLRYTSVFLNNVQGAQDSIALIINRVPYEKSESEIQNELRSVFAGVKARLEQVGRSSQDRATYENTKTLLDVFIAQPSLVGIFKSPKQAGLIMQDPEFKKERQTIYDLIHNKIRFVATVDQNFGYPLSVHTQRDLKDMVNKVSGAINNLLNTITDDIKKHYIQAIKDHVNMDMLSLQLHEDTATLKALNVELPKQTRAKEFLKQLIQGVVKAKIPIGTDEYTKLRLNTNHYDFMAYVDNTKENQIRKLPAEWLRKIQEVETLVEQYDKWFTMLVLLRNDLAQAMVNFEIDDTNYRQAIPKPEMTMNNYQRYLDNIKDVTSNRNLQEAINNVRNIRLDNPDTIYYLNEVLRYVLDQKPTIACVDNQVIANGTFIKLSDVINYKCDKKRGIKIYSTNMVHIDTSTQFKDEIDLTILAPRWHIDTHKGAISIKLAGIDANARKNKKAKNGDFDGQGGKMGKPGLPGHPSGNFLGVGKHFTNPDKLQIAVIGGEGGPGQHGGDGHDGTSIRPVEYMPECNYNVFYPVSSFTDYMEALGNIPDYAVNVTKVDYDYECGGLVWCTTFRYTLYPTKTDLEGGNGGNGGAGGLGGPVGQAHLITLGGNQRGAISFVKSVGPSGRVGVGGDGGRGGHMGWRNESSVTVEKHGYLFGPSPIYTNDPHDLGYERSGKRGEDGKNQNNIESPESPKPYVGAYDVNYYKKLLRDKFSNPIERNQLEGFLDKIESATSVQELYDTLSLVDDMNNLDSHYVLLKNKVNFLPHYESLQRRVETYAKGLNKTRDAEHIVLLKLKTAVYSKISDLTDNTYSVLVINLKDYLDLVKDEITELSQVSRDLHRLDTSETKISEINRKIGQMKQSITTEVLDEIEKIWDKMDGNVVKLVKDVRKLQNAAIEQGNDLVKKRSTLKNEIILKRVYGGLKIVGTAMAFLGPWGIAAGGAIQVGTSVAESLTLTGEGVQSLQDSITNGIEKLVETAANTALALRKKKIKQLDKQLSDINKEIKTNPSNLEELKERSEKISTKLDKYKKKIDGNEKTSGEDVKELNNIQNEVETALHSVAENLKDKLGEDSASYKVVAKLEKTAVITKACSDEIMQHLKDQEEIDEIGQALKESKKEFLQLEEFEKNILTLILPMLEEMKEVMQEVMSGASAEKGVPINVMKWKVQSTISDVKLEMSNIVKGMSVEGQVARNFDKLDKAIVTLIAAYNEIQEFQSEKQMVKYIESMNRENVENVVQDPNLRRAVLSLEQSYRRNIILQRYEQCVSSVKLNVFPYAKNFKPFFVLPKTNDLDILTTAAKNNIERLKSSWIQHKATSGIGQNSNGELHKKTYDTDEPYYIWDHRRFENEINQLLAGKQVTFKANVEENDEEYAVKFQRAEIEFVPLPGSALTKEYVKQAMKGFTVVQEHSGYSFYRCADKFYTMTHPPQLLEYRYDRNEGGYSKDINSNYDKILKGDVVMSPYTYWTIQLKHRSNDYSVLSNLIGKVEINLIGEGHYVASDTNICNNFLDEYQEDTNALSINRKGYDKFDTKSYIDESYLEAEKHRPQIGVTQTRSMHATRRMRGQRKRRNEMESASNGSEWDKDGMKSGASKKTSLINSVINLALVNIVAVQIGLEKLLKIGVDNIVKGFNHVSQVSCDFTLSIFQTQNWFTENVSQSNEIEGVNGRDQQPTKYDFDARSFYDTVNANLLLLPIATHFWAKFRNQKPPVYKMIQNGSCSNTAITVERLAEIIKESNLMYDKEEILPNLEGYPATDIFYRNDIINLVEFGSGNLLFEQGRHVLAGPIMGNLDLL